MPRGISSLKALLIPPKRREGPSPGAFSHAMAAQEGSEAWVARSSTASNSWWEVHSSPLSSWSTMGRWRPSKRHSNSSCDEHLSISNTTTSFANAATMDSSSADLSGEAVENHLWNQVLLNVGSGEDMHNNHDDRENFLEALNSKSLRTEMFDPASDYLKKMNSSTWEFTHPSSLNSLGKQLSSYNRSMIEPERLTNLSDLVGNWPISPPNPQLNLQMPLSTCNVSINPSMARDYMSNVSHIKHEIPKSPSYPGKGMVAETNAIYAPCYGSDTKGESQHQDMVASMPSFLRPFNTENIGCRTGLSSGITDLPWSNTRNLSDLVSFTGSLNKPAVDLRASPSYIKVSDSSDSNKQGFHTSSITGNGRSSGTTSEGKKKRSDDSSETLFKKSKHESSTTSSLKLQAPKVKLGDKITALQQFVSPFGKTDTASVLYEAINYIRFLHERVQLLSDPYMKPGASKDHNTWGGLEWKDKTDEEKLDLRSRGLCLVPISCTPQVCRDDTGPDYWTATYRGCLHR